MTQSMADLFEFREVQEWHEVESFWEDIDYSVQPEEEQCNSNNSIHQLKSCNSNNSIHPLKSTEILKNYCSKLKRWREESSISNQKPTISCLEAMRLAKVRLIQLNSQKVDIISNFKICFGSSLTSSGFTSDVLKDLEIALLIQAAAENVSNEQMVYAKKLINICFRSASVTGTLVQRTVYYFAEALRDRIDQEWGIMSSSEEKKWEKNNADYLDRVLVNPKRTAAQHEQPYCLVTQFAATETILENVASSKRVHLIDFSLENGSQWILIMQALAARTEFPLQLLKITAVGTCKPVMEKTGKWLASFAETIHLPFSFHVVVSDLKNLQRDLFEIQDDDAVAIHSMFRLWTFLLWPNHLRAFLGVIKSLKPCVMLTRELEVSTSSPVFLKRFDELLFFSSAMFDCLDECCKQHVEFRKQTEDRFVEMIHNTLTAEGSERYQRQEKISFWRAVFMSFGIVETDLSRLALCQGNLLLKRSDTFASCSLAMDGKSLIMGWNGTPLESLTAWKFH